MAIVVRRVGDRYSADVTPPHGSGTNWSSSEPTELSLLISQLERLGCHQTDIGDALYEADPRWLERLPGQNRAHVGD